MNVVKQLVRFVFLLFIHSKAFCLGHFGKVSQNMCWCAPLPVKPRAYSINPPSLSNKIFLGGIPHDLNERKERRSIENAYGISVFLGELAARLSQFGPVRIEWPAENNRTRRRTNHGR